MSPYGITIDLPIHGRRKVRACFDGVLMSSVVRGGWTGRVPAKRLLTDRTTRSVPEQVKIRGRSGCTGKLPHY